MRIRKLLPLALLLGVIACKQKAPPPPPEEGIAPSEAPSVESAQGKVEQLIDLTSNAEYQGYGASTKGGRGGDTCIVSTLADSGAGSLRDCMLTRTGPRTVTCQPGLTGTVKVASQMTVKMPFLTVNLSACPALNFEQPFKQHVLNVTATHDVIVHGIRMSGLWKPGQAYAGDKNTGVFAMDGDGGPISVPWDTTPNACGTALTDKRKICRWVFDGNVISGSSDAGGDLWSGVTDGTFSHNLIIDSYHPATTGSDTQAAPGSSKARERITEYANVYAYNGERQRKYSEGAYDIDQINDIIFAWQDYGSAIGKGVGGYGTLWSNDDHSDHHNVVGCIWMPDLEPGSAQVKACAANTNVTGPCRRAWDCVWGPTPKNNSEHMLGLHYERNVFGPWHNTNGSVECVSTTTGKTRFQRPYNLAGVNGDDLTAMEGVLDAAGITESRTVREALVISKVRAALQARLQ